MREWLQAGGEGEAVVVLGAPIARASITPSQAWTTPAAFRAALARFPTWDAATSADITGVLLRDAGDVEGDRDDPDASRAHGRIEEAVAGLAAGGALVVVIGGDNSLTRPAFTGAARARLVPWGLVTVDAHHDCRPATSGSANGTPVRELIEGGLPGALVAQVGIHPLGNSREDAEWAIARGIHVHPLEEVIGAGMETVFQAAVAEVRGNGAEAIYVDLDIDVVDRAYAPACPASLPAGLAPAELLTAARLAGREPSVAVVDLCEVDAAADVAGMTVRLMAATFTALCAGVATRRDAARAQ